MLLGPALSDDTVQHLAAQLLDSPRTVEQVDHERVTGIEERT
jgi:hypothetical protein